MNHLEYKIGETIYYRGRNTSTSYIIPFNSDEPTREQIDTFEGEVQGEMVESKIVEILDGGHDFLYGFFNSLKLENGNEIHSHRCFLTKEEYKKSYKSKPIIDHDDDWKGIQFPIVKNIFPKLLAEDLISVQPLK